MSHKLSQTEIFALHYTAVAYRPDWHHNRPGSTWQTQLQEAGTPMTLPHADDFHHALRALAHYCHRKTSDGTHIMRTPIHFVHDGKHWTETRRPDETTQPPCDQHGTDYGNKETCKACRSEILAGHRPETMMGRHYEPSNPSEAQPTTSPENPNTDPQDSPATPQASQDHAQEEN